VTYDDAPIGEFLDDIASERVAPAGGTAAAITGATGAALCEMVCVHTMAAEQPRSNESSEVTDTAETDRAPGAEHIVSSTDPEPSFPEVRAGLRRRRKALLALADRDGAVVEELFGADRHSSTRVERRAAGIPLAVSEAALEVLLDAETVFRHGRAGVAADAKTGAYLADATVRASVETVRINVAALPEGSFAAGIEERAADVTESAAAVRGRLFGAEE
jgi:formiminotetrahydrofolate cyclodeaminase